MHSSKGLKTEVENPFQSPSQDGKGMLLGNILMY